MKVNAILKKLKSENITETNRLIRACAIFVGTKPKKRKCNERTMVGKKNARINTRVAK